MFDLVSKNLTAEEQIAYKKFCDFNKHTPNRSDADFDYANKLRGELGDKLCTLSLFEWHAITVYAYHVAEDLIGVLKHNGVEDKPQDDPLRETLTSLRVLTSSLRKNHGHWLNNGGFAVNGKCVHGLLTAISTICGQGISGLFDQLFELAEREVKPCVLRILAKVLGVNPEDLGPLDDTKDDLRRAMYRLIMFCSKNANGFAIC